MEGDNLIIENRHGEIVDEAKMQKPFKDEEDAAGMEHPSIHEEPHMSPIQSIVSGQPLSPLKKILSPTSLHKLHSIVDENSSKRSSIISAESSDSHRSRRRRKYHAYKTNGELIIENEDGDVIRRYKIHHHENTNKKKSQRVNKMLNSVGIRRNGSTKSKDSTEASSPIQDERSAPEVLTKKHRTLTPAPHMAAGYIPMPFSEEETDDSFEEDEDDTTDNSEVSDSESYSDESDEDSETEFERQRRLHALGQAPAPRVPDVDDNDEEVMPITTLSPGQSNTDGQSTSGPKNTLASKFSRKFGFHK